MEIFCLTEPKNFVEEPFCVAENFWYRKRSRERERGGSITTFPKKFVVSQYRKTSSGKLLFQKISGIKNCQEEREREGGHHDFPSKICFPTVPSNFVGETCVSENFWYRKMLRIREREGGASRLSVEILSSHSTENLRRGNLCFRKFLVSKNVKDKRERGGHHDFPSKICFPTVPSNFVGETCVSENFWYRKMLRIRERGGCITTFCRNFVVSQYRKTSSGKLLFQKISGIKNCQEERERGGGITTFPRKFVFPPYRATS